MILYRCQYETVPQCGPHTVHEKIYYLHVTCFFLGVPLLNVNLGLGLWLITV